MNFENKLINRKWKIIKKITTKEPIKYLAKNVTNNKFASLKVSNKKNKKYLQNEAMILKKLKKSGFPKIIWHGEDFLLNNHTFLIINQLGPSIKELFILCKKKFTLKTVLMIGILCVDILKYLHSKNFIHKNINPDNLFVGIENMSNSIILANYEYSEKFKDDFIDFHKGLKENDEFVDNKLFSSIRSDLFMNSSRRDDFESLGYLLVYLLKGGLPWEKYLDFGYQSIESFKREILIGELCEGLNYEFCVLLNYFRDLGFEQVPNYAFIKDVLVKLFNQKGFTFDFKFDWIQNDNLIQKEILISFSDNNKLNTIENQNDKYIKSKFSKKISIDQHKKIILLKETSKSDSNLNNKSELELDQKILDDNKEENEKNKIKNSSKINCEQILVPNQYFLNTKKSDNNFNKTLSFNNEDKKSILSMKESYYNSEDNNSEDSDSFNSFITDNEKL